MNNKRKLSSTEIPSILRALLNRESLNSRFDILSLSVEQFSELPGVGARKISAFIELQEQLKNKTDERKLFSEEQREQDINPSLIPSSLQTFFEKAQIIKIGDLEDYLREHHITDLPAGVGKKKYRQAAELLQEIKELFSGSQRPEIVYQSIPELYEAVQLALPENEFQILIGKYVQGKNNSDIAREIGKSRELVRQKLQGISKRYLNRFIIPIREMLEIELRELEEYRKVYVEENIKEIMFLLGCVGLQTNLLCSDLLTTLRQREVNDLKKKILSEIVQHKGTSQNDFLSYLGISLTEIDTSSILELLEEDILNILQEKEFREKIDFLAPDRVRAKGYQLSEKDKLGLLLEKYPQGLSQKEIRSQLPEFKNKHATAISRLMASIPTAFSIQHGLFCSRNHIELDVEQEQKIIDRIEENFLEREDLITVEEIFATTKDLLPAQYQNNPYISYGIACRSEYFDRETPKTVKSIFSFDEEKVRLVEKYPKLVAEIDRKFITEEEIATLRPTIQRKIYWRCTKGHSSYPMSVHARTILNQGCPLCGKKATRTKVRLFVESLQEHILAFTQSERYSLFLQTGILNSQGIGGDLAKEILQKNALKDSFQKLLKKDSNVPKDLDDGDIDEKDILALPLVQAKDSLKALDSTLFATFDEKAMEFFVASAKAKLWRHAYEDLEEARQQTEEYIGGEYGDIVRGEFLSELKETLELELPKGYSFQVDGQIAPPLLMQRLCALRIKKNRRYGNWSGTGAGKTLAAILSTRVVDAKLTVICCPNPVVENWKKQIRQIFPNSQVQTSWNFHWDDSSEYRYLILNYEKFQQEYSRSRVQKLSKTEDVDFVIFDEIHYAKQTKPAEQSIRKGNVGLLIQNAGQKNEELCVLGLSATPIINNLQEGVSLLELILGESLGLQTRPTINNCMRIYQYMVTHGTRWKPNYEKLMTLNLQEIDVDCSGYIPELLTLDKQNPLDVEKILTEARIPTIISNLEKGKKTLLYTYYVDGIADRLKQAIEEEGFSVGFYTGEDKSGLEGFLYGDTEVLIGTKSIGTGVDGLQHVCQRLIINVLPWTNAEYEQLLGRIYRQGSNFEHIEVIIPKTYAEIDGEYWSYCETKWKRLLYKRTLGDAAMDGVVPKANLRSKTQAHKDLMAWLHRLSEKCIA